MKIQTPEKEEKKSSKKKEAAVIPIEKVPAKKTLSKEPKKTSHTKELTIPKEKSSSSPKSAKIIKVSVKSTDAEDQVTPTKKENKLSNGVKKIVAKGKSIKKASVSAAPMGNLAPAAFSKAAFEEQVNLAIRESIARQKDVNRVYDPAITNKMKSIIANYTESPELLENIENNTNEHFVEDLNIDSVDFVEIIVDAEEAFQIKMEDDEIKALRSFDDLYDLIEGKIKARDNSKK